MVIRKHHMPCTPTYTHMVIRKHHMGISRCLSRVGVLLYICVLLYIPLYMGLIEAFR